MSRIQLPQAVCAVMQALERRGYAVYVVGGAVRDALAGKTPHDYDLCTDARPEQVKAACRSFSVLETGLKHGTVTVLSDGQPLEVTTFRREGAYSDGRRPDSVQFVSAVETDLSRRDFTVNAMAWHPERGLVDPFGGQADLQRGILRCVGQPEQRFDEDALRILRALRFAAEWGWRLETHTAQAVLACADDLRHISAERITAELLRTLCGAYAGQVLLEYGEVFARILPEVRPMLGFDQRNFHHKYDVWEHSVRAVEGIRPEPVLRLTMLLHDVGKPAVFTMDEQGVGHFYGHPIQSYRLAQHALRRLRLPTQMEEDVLYLVRHHDTPLGSNHKQVRRKLAVHGEERFRALLAVKKADAIGQGTSPISLSQLLDTQRLLEEVLQEEGRMTLRQLAIDGRDLLQLGLRGPSVGACLSALLNQVLDDPSRNTREQLLQLAADFTGQTDCMKLTVNGMSARHCVKQVQRLLERVPGVQSVRIDLPSGRVELKGQSLSMTDIRCALTAAGYEVVL